MKYIKKKATPAELIAYRSTSGANYKDLIKNHSDIADIVRLSLADEQGYICCYCGRKIDGIEHTRIEHIFPKSLPVFLNKTFFYHSLSFDFVCDYILSFFSYAIISISALFPNSLSFLHELIAFSKAFDKSTHKSLSEIAMS